MSEVRDIQQESNLITIAWKSRQTQNETPPPEYIGVLTQTIANWYEYFLPILNF